MNQFIKRIIAAALIGTSFTCTAAMTVAASPKYVKIKGEPVVVRADAGLSSKYIKKVHRDNQLIYLAQKSDSSDVIWYQVELSDGKKGWVTSNLSETIDSSLVGKLEVGAKLMNVRSGPSLTSDTYGTVTIGTQFDYFSKTQDAEGQPWYKIQYNAEQTAWLLGTYCNIIKQPSQKTTTKATTKTTTKTEKTTTTTTKKTTTKTTNTTASKQVEITASPVNVRDSASLSGKKIGRTSMGKKFAYLASKTDASGNVWYQIQYTAQTKGWVLGRLSKMIATETTSTTKSTTKATTKATTKTTSKTENNNSAKQVEITTSPVNVRDSASLSGKKIGRTSMGKKFAYLASKTDASGNVWYQIQYTAQTKGWVLGRLSQIIVIETKKVEITASTVNVRDTASTSGKKIGTAAKGNKYVYLASKNDSNGQIWYQIQYTAQTKGWVTGKYSKTITE